MEDKVDKQKIPMQTKKSGQSDWLYVVYSFETRALYSEKKSAKNEAYTWYNLHLSRL